MRHKILNYINGKLIPSGNNHFLDNINPATGTVYSRLPDSEAADVADAVAAAEKAFAEWSTCRAEVRARYLNRIADLIAQRLDDFARAETTDTGKPLQLSRTVDIPRAVRNFRFFAAGALHFASESHWNAGTSFHFTLRQPVGVAGCISPWNLPLYLLSWKIAPALAAGCTVVAKPSELTPMTAFLLAKVCMQAGLPKGVLNIVHGYGNKAGHALCAHPGVKAISFTGGTHTGKAIAQTTAAHFKKLSLELGGKNPTIIFADCDFDKMLDTTLRSSFSNQGQICLCGSRILIEESLYPEFRKAFIERVKKLKVGDPLSKSTDLGAVISTTHLEKIMRYITLAQHDGGTLLTGGRLVKPKGRCRNGYFAEPTVMEGVDPHCAINQEEVFGPVVTLLPFKTEEEALAVANGTPYGLAATLWTRNLSRALRIAEQIQSGIVWINCWMERDLRTPFGGVKQSGVGREGGWEAFRFFTEPKNVCIQP
ncbi:MAG: 2-hydroxymuconic semialdehyde dehydrogenase [Chitinophagales bacterium]|nr:MAG: 2-hydroxymuconic semialdehyde dehydrogenase [Chitinophagales bacterium]